ncbi:MAG: phasin family protein [Pseudomonadota bacterium]
MNEQMKMQADKMLEFAKEARIPENVQAMAEETVINSRAAYDQFAETAHNQSKVAGQMFDAAHVGMRTLGEKAMENMTANTMAAFDAAEEIVRARTMPEAVRLQADFFQQQVNVAGKQTQEFMELSTQIAQEAFQTMSSAAATATAAQAQPVKKAASKAKR